MKVEKKYTIPARKAVPAKKATRVEVICDICSAPVVAGNYGSGGGRCELCGRDVCAEHKLRHYPDGGDYSDKYCTICYKLYIPALEQLQEQQWQEKEKLQREIKQISLTQGIAV